MEISKIYANSDQKLQVVIVALLEVLQVFVNALL